MAYSSTIDRVLDALQFERLTDGTSTKRGIRVEENLQRYASMQKGWYEQAARASKYDMAEKADAVVGSYDAHNRWPDYDKYLMKYVDHSFKDKVALDFACGPGRGIVKYHHLFKRLDGADIAQANLDNAAANCAFHNVPPSNLFLTSGTDCGAAEDNSYDLVFSMIALQHICVHDTRFAIMTDMYRILRKLGRISIQMGFGKQVGKHPYHANVYDAEGTNSLNDTMVENPDDIEVDLLKIGFTNFEYWVRPPVPGDNAPQAIFFTAVK